MRPSLDPPVFHEDIRWRGNWSNATAYEVGDAVHYSGSAYVALQEHTNQTPSAAADTAYWGRLALKGDTGATGATGATGPQGDPGADGEGSPPINPPEAVADAADIGTDSGRYANEDHVHAKHADQASAAALAADEAALAAHIGDTADAHDASAISVVPFSSIAATNVQAALEEVVAEQSGGVTDHGALTGLSDPDHPIAAVSGLQAALDGKQALSEKGANNGYASLDAGGDVPASQLGNVTAPPFVGCRVYRTTNQSLPNGAAASILWDAEDFDTGLHSTASNTDRLTADRTGYWLVVAEGAFNSNGTGQRFLRFFKNGTSTARSQLVPVSGDETHINASVILHLAATEYVTVSAFQNSGDALDLIGGNNNGSWFGMTFLGA